MKSLFNNKNIRTILESENFRWIYINGIKTNYLVSTYGRIMNISNSHKEPFILKSFVHKEHEYVSISIHGHVHRFQVHRLVAFAFIPNPENKPIVHHIDKNPLNNKVDNLMWVTEVEHKIYHKDEMDNNRPEPKYGEDCNLSVYKESQIHEVCKLLEENIHTKKEIEQITGVNVETIKAILSPLKQQWRKISKNYDIKKYNVAEVKNMRKGSSNSSSKITEDDAHYICKMLENGYSVRDIHESSGISKKIIQHIKYHNTWNHISNEYNF